MSMPFTEAMQEYGRPIAYYPNLARAIGSIKAAVFLSQLIYWTQRSIKDGWICKSAKDIEAETGLSKKEQRTARACLRGLGMLTEQVKNLPPTVHYRLNTAKVNAAFVSSLTGSTRN